MKKNMKTLIAGAIGAAALCAGAAWAKPAYCNNNHDHRSHAADYYSYYPADNYSRSGAYRSSGLSISVNLGDRDYDRRDRGYDRRGRDYDRRDDRGRNNGYRGDRGRVVNREVYDTRYRARIILIEEVVRTRHGPQLICTIDARGPQARYVPNKQLRKIARKNCSRRAQVRIVT